MKRTLFIILWAFGFLIATLIAGTAIFRILTVAGIISWPVPMLIGEIWAVVCIGSPLIGLSLGSRGILPGTEKSKKL
jgi:hypothetical protein